MAAMVDSLKEQDDPIIRTHQHSGLSDVVDMTKDATMIDEPESVAAGEEHGEETEQSTKAIGITTKSVTPPPRVHELSRQASGLPPTPPRHGNVERNIETNSVTNESAPMFADPVRNVLSARSSELSTPAVDNRSPPTPDSIPPAIEDSPVRPPLRHSSTFGINLDSFTTAYEEHDEDLRAPFHQSGLSNAPEEIVTGNDERANGVPTTSSHSPLIESRKQLEHRAAFQRLRSVIQPGDSLKRPDEALLYGPSTWVRPSLRAVASPPQPMSNGVNSSPTSGTEESLHRTMDHVHVEQSSPVMDEEHAADSPALTQPQPEQDEEIMRNGSAHSSNPDSVHAATQDANTPPAATIADNLMPLAAISNTSLDDNNSVYKIIQQENVKRHDSGSQRDRHIQAAIIFPPQRKRTLRHATKRESLRSNENEGSGHVRKTSDGSAHKLRHASGHVGPQNNEDDSARDTISPMRVEKSVNTEQSVRNKIDLNGVTPLKAATVPTRSVSLGAQPSPASIRLNGHSLRRSSRDNRLERSASLRESSAHTTPSISSSTPRRVSTNPTIVPHVSKQRHATPLRSHDLNDEKLRRSSLDRTLSAQAQAASDALEALARQSALLALQSPDPHPAERKMSEDRKSDMRNARDSGFAIGPRASIDRGSVASGRRKSLDPRSQQPLGTPFSVSQFSVRTDVELCEATGVKIFPHNNDSLLLVQQGAPPTGRQPMQTDSPLLAPATPVQSKALDKHDEIGIHHPGSTVDSPLTKPRAAPQPPVIRYTPATPNDDLERTLSAEGAKIPDARPTVQRSLSLTEHVRRYSVNVIQPMILGRSQSLRHRIVRAPTPERPRHLSSVWRPRGFWAGYDSDDDDEEYFEDEDRDVLPAGGDTSDVGHGEDDLTGQHTQNVAGSAGRSFLPRSLSVRLPTFRGASGFLVGGMSDPLNRGSNVRRHYVTTGSREVVYVPAAEQRKPDPASSGSGLGALRDMVGEMRRKRRESDAEKRRAKLRSQIGMKVYHDG